MTSRYTKVFGSCRLMRQVLGVSGSLARPTAVQLVSFCPTIAKKEEYDTLISSRLLCSLGTLSSVTLNHDATKSRPLTRSLSRYEEE